MRNTREHEEGERKIAYTLRSRRFFFYMFKWLSNDGFSTLCAQCVFVDHLESTWLEVVPPTENGIFIGLQENVTENVQILRFLFMPTLMTRPVLLLSVLNSDLCVGRLTWWQPLRRAWGT